MEASEPGNREQPLLSQDHRVNSISQVPNGSRTS